ncbi:MAG: bifunctional hydroxymethylpyrimidine kinase/phosphomethylpyrimidine kinase [Betaproteobacteria bacterium]|nr:bifunctional hydroxymethylpyrimidine kinase/phosphomethylpyrimidine kinase [Betaproteobacteria bacterium]
MTAIPNALTIAGVDPSGGAGVLADLKTFSALGAYGCAVIAALTAQNTRAVTGVQAVAPDFIRLQIDTLFDDVRIDAVKIGMLGEAATVRAVAEALARQAPPFTVLDPVMVAKSGDALLDRAGVATLREALLPLADVITPNLPEAGVLLEGRGPETKPEMYRAAERLRNLQPLARHCWVLLKGGHLPGAELLDLLFDGDRMIELPGRRLDTKNTHGTGCTLSSAIAALRPQRPDVPAAVTDARAWLLRAIAAADQLDVGRGHGPVHHLHALWAAAGQRQARQSVHSKEQYP